MTLKKYLPYAATTALLVFIAAKLVEQGRLIICSCNKVYLWAANPWSNDNSQHISDPYSFSHLQHGLIFYFALKKLAPKMSESWRLFFAVLIESGWELLENSSFIIDKYRSNTASVQYNGDTVINSISDILFCILGFIIAKYIGGKFTLTLFILIEVAMIYLMKDSLIINIIMIVYPVRGLLDWQIRNGY
jgi:hypothetical protein